MPRFQFTLRDYLWVIVIWGLAIGWWLDHSNAFRKRASISALSQRVSELEAMLHDQQSREQHLIDSVLDLKPNKLVLSHTRHGWEVQKLSVPIGAPTEAAPE